MPERLTTPAPRIRLSSDWLNWQAENTSADDSLDVTHYSPPPPDEDTVGDGNGWQQRFEQCYIEACDDARENAMLYRAHTSQEAVVASAVQRFLTWEPPQFANVYGFFDIGI